MKSFQAIYDRAAKRQGGEESLKKKWPKPLSAKKLQSISDDRWLSDMSRSVFQAGFNWRVVDNKWPDFETVFENFDLVHCAYLSDEDIEGLTNDKRVIRHLTKLQSVRANATYLLEQSSEHGGVGTFITQFGPERYAELLIELKKNASRMGGTSAQYCLRRIGLDSFVLSRDVVKALQQAKIVEKSASSKRDLMNIQSAFNHWREQTGLSMSAISRTLAMSVD
ncbi:MAG: DNA-3-methyladenine glycosylase I [Pseudomonadota bacterium]